MVTRSQSRNISNPPPATSTQSPSSSSKRKISATTSAVDTPQKAKRKKEEIVESVPKLFVLEEAQRHYARLDHRWKVVFDSLECSIYQPQPDGVSQAEDPFRALCKSILGQQIAWQAARKITYRFIRIFFPSLPEIMDDDHSVSISPFPTPAQVLSLPEETRTSTLRSAGLSGSKASYIISLSEHFSSGKLTDEFLANGTDEEIQQSLVAVKGIGEWTCQMFMMFGLKRGDVLPVGDLGVQKGLLRWFAAEGNGDPSIAQEEKKKDNPAGLLPEGKFVLPPTPARSTSTYFPACPNTGLTKPIIKSRLAKSKIKGTGGGKVKGAYLTREEMEELTADWRPYRTLGVWYMWSLVDNK